ncbi:hypothetical protein QP794_06935 [Paenibacillus sp. UMB7766-LJ446]|uniref:hypothetical protein n=1 Tax=Paenibacillus sp. UMB7766-LJ446 TaxID=3046313 RepID=UPI00254EFC5B|nr:hypothetical protein [Paenibacillus sp. UMB7766-LJ446]MDK8189819.1 hypothetical protein [Paenibacillus sp. UMB7766-LJ446]
MRELLQLWRIERCPTTLIALGVPEKQIRVDVIPDGTHYESTWGVLFPEVHRWLLQP